MTGWEYLIISLSQFEPAKATWGASASVTVLNREGVDGWEAVGMTPLGDGSFAVLMKRPVDRPPDGWRFVTPAVDVAQVLVRWWGQMRLCFSLLVLDAGWLIERGGGAPDVGRTDLLIDASIAPVAADQRPPVLGPSRQM